jgi:hypothetical protein
MTTPQDTASAQAELERVIETVQSMERAMPSRIDGERRKVWHGGDRSASASGSKAPLADANTSAGVPPPCEQGQREAADARRTFPPAMPAPSVYLKKRRSLLANPKVHVAVGVALVPLTWAALGLTQRARPLLADFTLNPAGIAALYAAAASLGTDVADLGRGMTVLLGHASDAGPLSAPPRRPAVGTAEVPALPARSILLPAAERSQVPGAGGAQTTGSRGPEEATEAPANTLASDPAPSSGDVAILVSAGEETDVVPPMESHPPWRDPRTATSEAVPVEPLPLELAGIEPATLLAVSPSEEKAPPSAPGDHVHPPASAPPLTPTNQTLDASAPHPGSHPTQSASDTVLAADGLVERADVREAESMNALEREREPANVLALELAEMRAEASELRSRPAVSTPTIPQLPLAEHPTSSPGTELGVVVPPTMGELRDPIPPQIAARGATPLPVTGPPAAQQAEPTPQPVPHAPAPTSPLEKQLIERALTLIGSRDISGARLVLERAAAQGSKRAIYLLAQTYDPKALKAWAVIGLPGDQAMADVLYRKAGAADMAMAR